MYNVNGKPFNSYLQAVRFAQSVDGDVTETETGLRRWTPGKKPTARKMRQYREQKAAYEAQERARNTSHRS